MSSATLRLRGFNCQGLLLQVLDKFEVPVKGQQHNYQKLQPASILTYSRRFKTNWAKIRRTSTSAAAVEEIPAVRCNNEEGMLEVSWSAGEHPSKFPYVWLRDNCLCEKCHHPISHARNFYMKDLDLDVTPVDVDVSAYIFIVSTAVSLDTFLTRVPSNCFTVLGKFSQFHYENQVIVETRCSRSSFSQLTKVGSVGIKSFYSTKQLPPVGHDLVITGSGV